MNIFYLHNDPTKAAEAQPDKLLVKMVLESAQLLCTSHRVLDGDERADSLKFYRKTHMNHPCSKWVRESSGNYDWLFNHFIALANEYTYRYGKTHACYQKFNETLKLAPSNINQSSMTPVALAMPDQYRHSDPVKSYREYVIAEKTFAEWNKNRSKPIWWTQ